MKNPMPLACVVKELGKRHGKTWVLRKLNFEVAPGSMVALLGANGSGKSILLRMMCGMDGWSEGEVNWSIGQNLIERKDLAGAISY